MRRFSGPRADSVTVNIERPTRAHRRPSTQRSARLGQDAVDAQEVTRAPGAVASSVVSTGLVSSVEADRRALAEERAATIRGAIKSVSVAETRLCLLLAVAHRYRDWESLGYTSFGAYLHAELSIGRAHGYRMLDHAAVLVALGKAADLPPEQVPVDERAARRVKSELPAIATAIQAHVATVAPEQRPAIVRDVVAAAALSPAGDSQRRRTGLDAVVSAIASFDHDRSTPADAAAALADALCARFGDDSETLARLAALFDAVAAALRAQNAGSARTAGLRRRPARLPSAALGVGDTPLPFPELSTEPGWGNP